MKANDTPGLRNRIWKIGAFFVAFTWEWGYESHIWRFISFVDFDRL
jgi:hypothetical protein